MSDRKSQSYLTVTIKYVPCLLYCKQDNRLAKSSVSSMDNQQFYGKPPFPKWASLFLFMVFAAQSDIEELMRETKMKIGKYLDANVHPV